MADRGSVPRRARRRGRAGVAAVAAALAIGLAGCSGGGGANGQVGDCAKDATGSDDITIVPCTDGDAQYRVVGVEEHVSSGGAGVACLKYDEATSNLWFGASGDFGRVLCLGPVSA